jgi:ribosome biogenesis GTPase A
MTKAFRLMEKEIKLVDAIIYVLDSRAPFSCVNPKFPTLIGDKPIIYVFNKSDIADKTKLDGWINGYFKRENTRCIVLDSTSSGSGKKVESAILDVCKPKIEKFKLKGIKPTIRAMVIGVPNCGKSTLINNLCGKAKTITGNKPGVTKGKQWVKIASGIELLDMPGTLWPAFDNTHVARHLAYIGSIREEVLDIPELALDFVGDIRKIDKTILEKRFSIEITEENTNLEVIELICESRKYLLRGGDYDYDRCCSAIISEFKHGKLGNITLDNFKDLKMLMKKDRKESNNA